MVLRVCLGLCVCVRGGGSLPPLGFSYWLPNVQMLKPVYVQKYVGTVTKCSNAKANVCAEVCWNSKCVGREG